MALVADFADEHERMHSEKREARFYGYYGFIRKCGLVVGAILFTVLIKSGDGAGAHDTGVRLVGTLITLLFIGALLAGIRISIKEHSEL